PPRCRPRRGGQPHCRRGPRRRRWRGMTVAALDIDALAAVVADALAEAGRSIDDLSAAAAIEIADALRAIVAAPPAPTTHDKRLAPDLDAAAGIVEQRTGTG